jgi:hypothetical protein
MKSTLTETSDGTLRKPESCYAPVSREAYGVRPACRRFLIGWAAGKRERAPRTPYASRGLAAFSPISPRAFLWFHRKAND